MIDDNEIEMNDLDDVDLESALTELPENACKICLDEVRDYPNFIPCRCRYPVHYECLEMWVNERNTNLCEICQCSYNMKYNYKFSCGKMNSFILKYDVWFIYPIFLLFFSLISIRKTLWKLKISDEEYQCYKNFDVNLSNFDSYNFLNILSPTWGQLFLYFVAILINLSYLAFGYYILKRYRNDYLKRGKIILAALIIQLILQFLFGNILLVYLFNNVSLSEIVPSYICPQYYNIRFERDNVLRDMPDISLITFLPGYLAFFSIMCILSICFIVIGFTLIGLYYIFKSIFKLILNIYNNGFIPTICICCYKQQFVIENHQQNV